MSNFAFMPDQFRSIAESAAKAERQIMGDARASCFHSRFALEAIVHWLYEHDASLVLPYDKSLGALLHDPAFQNLLPQAVFQKARAIQKMGNQAVHSRRPVRQFDALQLAQELHHVCYWLVRTYAQPDLGTDVFWSKDRIPKQSDGDTVPRSKLEELEAKLEARNKEQLKKAQERLELDSELQQLRKQLAEFRAAAAKQKDHHDYAEAETRAYLIDVDLLRAGWALDGVNDKEYQVADMPNQQGVGYVDYVLWGDDGKPLAVVEAKKTTVDPMAGQQQAKLYADCIQKMHDRRPIIFYTNGYETWLWDDQGYPPRKVAGFFKKEELERLILRRGSRKSLDVKRVKDEIAGRYYQKRAIGSIFNQFTTSRRKALLVMATGTGKTRTAIALVDALQRAGWVKRALFLADRISLVNQAVNAFKEHLPESSPVNLVTEKDAEGRVHVSTYPTMMGLIDENDGGTARFGVGHFDIVIIDEAHRSVYQKYGAIFEYFDSLLVGLTATPREQVDKNTYTLFDLEPGVPTDAYELEQAVNDGFLVPPKKVVVDLRFPREGIDYDDLTDEEKEQWESIDWGDEAEEQGLPDHVNATAINNWLFNTDTVDKVLQYLMLNGIKVDGGDRLGKTIIFARNHDHAVFVEQRFNHHYPEYKGQFARVIDNYAKYAQSLIDDFSQKESDPHIAISVDMLDTGIDIPEIVNLVFFKPVYSKIKFWQMIGRGTRLCPELFGPDDDKAYFKIFDFCFNFQFFDEHPDGIETSTGVPLGTRLFRRRLELAGALSVADDVDPGNELKGSLIDGLYEQVRAMNVDNFLVRMHLEAVDKFQKRESWQDLTEDDFHVLGNSVSSLPTTLASEDIETRLFDHTMLKMQLAQVQGDHLLFERLRLKVIDIASLLEEKPSIPSVKVQLAFLAAMQATTFWEDITLKMLEDVRLRLRGLTPFLDKKERKTVYTDFQDEVVGVHEDDVIYMPSMTGAQYEKKVRACLQDHLNHIAVQRLRTNQPLTKTDLESLEKVLVGIGEHDGKYLLSGLLERSGAPSLEYFVRNLVGLDRSAAQTAFSEFLNDRSLTAQQIRFIEMVIDQLTSRGIMEPGALYESPFTDIHSGGPDVLFAGKVNVIEGIFGKLKDIYPRVS